jgi:hypothetical protein
MQEGCRKDIERCFGVLQSRFAIVAHLCRQWDLGTLKAIMYACIVMHNMIVEDESGEMNLESDFPQSTGSRGPTLQRSRTLQDLKSDIVDVQDPRKHMQLKSDLIEHLWAVRGARQRT